jgi:hypothetical protein
MADEVRIGVRRDGERAGPNRDVRLGNADDKKKQRLRQDGAPAAESPSDRPTSASKPSAATADQIMTGSALATRV